MTATSIYLIKKEILLKWNKTNFCFDDFEHLLSMVKGSYIAYYNSDEPKPDDYNYLQLVKSMKNDKILEQKMKIQFVSVSYNNIKYENNFNNRNLISLIFSTFDLNSSQIGLYYDKNTDKIELVCTSIYKYGLINNLLIPDSRFIKYFLERNVLRIGKYVKRYKMNLLSPNYLDFSENVFNKDTFEINENFIQINQELKTKYNNFMVKWIVNFKTKLPLNKFKN